jgi:hypothetical protein
VIEKSGVWMLDEGFGALIRMPLRPFKGWTLNMEETAMK